MPDRKPVIAVLGGTGKEGGGLALRWAHQGHKVILGSRSAERAAAAAAAMNEALDGGGVAGAGNADAAAQADIIVLAVPYAAQQATVDEVAAKLAGKILVDVTVPLVPPKVSRVQLPEGGSASISPSSSSTVWAAPGGSAPSASPSALPACRPFSTFAAGRI